MKVSKNLVLIFLILVGIVLITLSVYRQYVKPYQAEKNLEKLDVIRIQDLGTLDSLIKSNISASSTMYIGASSTIYISIPSDDPTCSNLDLPSVPDGWAYHCSNNENYQKVDGTGWMPINFESKIDRLPVDEKNNVKTSSYYIYIASSTNEYFIAGTLNSKMLLKEKAQNDNGVDDTKYELGNNLKIWKETLGLLAYFPFNEDGGDVAFDKSENGHDMNLPVDDLYTKEGCLLKNCISNKTLKDITIYFPSVLPMSSSTSFSYQIWFKISETPKSSTQIFNPGTSRLDFNVEGGSAAIFLWFQDKGGKGGLLYKSSPHEYVDSAWHQLLVSKNTESIIVYLDGHRASKFETSTSTYSDNAFASMVLPEGTSINSLSLYSRSLSKEDALNYFLSLKQKELK